MARPIDGELLKNAIQSWIDTQSELVDVETCAMVLAAIAVMPTLTPPNEWVSVDERLPEPGERVLAADGSFVGEVYMASNGTWFRHDGFLLKIDHWMPLPEPPKEE